VNPASSKISRRTLIAQSAEVFGSALTWTRRDTWSFSSYTAISADASTEKVYLGWFPPTTVSEGKKPICEYAYARRLPMREFARADILPPPRDGASRLTPRHHLRRVRGQPRASAGARRRPRATRGGRAGGGRAEVRGPAPRAGKG